MLEHLRKSIVISYPECMIGKKICLLCVSEKYPDGEIEDVVSLCSFPYNLASAFLSLVSKSL